MKQTHTMYKYKARARPHIECKLQVGFNHRIEILINSR